MEMTFRWYGETDPVTLDMIRQIPGVTGIVSAVYDVPVGKVWSVERINVLKKAIENKGMNLSVIESVPVHEDIKLGKPSRDKLIENYCETLRNLAAAGVHTVCYNFMPVFDWTRTELAYESEDGSHALAYFKEKAEKMNPVSGELSLPGWDESYTKDGLTALMEEYKNVSEEDLWDNLKYFLERVIKTAEEVKVKMAIHPDDPPWNIFGLPRIIKNRESLDRLVKLVDSPYNGITLCSGSLAADERNDVPELVRHFGGMGRIHFAHCRNILRRGGGSFEESAHLSSKGSLDMYEILKAYSDTGFDGPMRPDHGRMIWGETGKPGYGLYDRALGAVYLGGLWEAIKKSENK